jgi:hypothetical protein
MTSVLSPTSSLIVVAFIFYIRKPCLCRPSRFSVNTATTPPTEQAPPPVCLADKPKRRKRSPNVFVNNRGFPDKTEHYDALLRNINGGVILRKLKHPPPSLDEVDPLFLHRYNKATHGEQMRRNLDLSHLEPHIPNRVYALVMKYWSVFDKNEVFVPVKNYE